MAASDVPGGRSGGKPVEDLDGTAVGRDVGTVGPRSGVTALRCHAWQPRQSAVHQSGERAGQEDAATQDHQAPDRVEHEVVGGDHDANSVAIG